MEALSVTIEDLKQTAGGIRQENQTLRKCLMEIHVCMNQLTNEWQSPAATTIRERFQSLLPIFDNYEQIIDNYAKFLDTTAATYQDMEQKLNQHADSFR